VNNGSQIAESDGDDLIALRRRVAELEGAAAQLQESEAAAREQAALMQSIINQMGDGVIVADTQGKFLVFNDAASRMFGLGATDTKTEGWSDRYGLFLPDMHTLYPPHDLPLARAMRGESTTDIDVFVRHERAPAGLWILHTGRPIYDARGAIKGGVIVCRDVTASKHAQAEHTRLQEQIIEMQEAALRQLSTPLIPITDQVMVMPLIGTVDSQRAQAVLETLLTGVATNRARVVILDITGVSVVDAEVANGLLRAASAVTLLGAQLVLTGIRPEVAQTLVGIGADLGGVITRGTLQSGIAWAIQHGSAAREHALR
jgi:rsbT co-antagonist protein RsbR